MAVTFDDITVVPFAPPDRDHQYLVHGIDQYVLLCCWMKENNVEYVHDGFGPHGAVFTVTSNHEWFALRWL